MTTTEQSEFAGMPEPIPPPPPEPYIVTGDITYNADVKVDLADLIRKYPAEYETVDLSGGFSSWERPVKFLHEFLDEAFSADVGSEVIDTWATFDFSESGRWSQERFESLCAICPEARVDA